MGGATKQKTKDLQKMEKKEVYDYIRKKGNGDLIIGIMNLNDKDIERISKRKDGREILVDLHNKLARWATEIGQQSDGGWRMGSTESWTETNESLQKYKKYLRSYNNFEDYYEIVALKLYNLIKNLQSLEGLETSFAPEGLEDYPNIKMYRNLLNGITSARSTANSDLYQTKGTSRIVEPDEQRIRDPDFINLKIPASDITKQLQTDVLKDFNQRFNGKRVSIVEALEWIQEVKGKFPESTAQYEFLKSTEEYLKSELKKRLADLIKITHPGWKVGGDLRLDFRLGRKWTLSAGGLYLYRDEKHGVRIPITLTYRINRKNDISLSVSYQRSGEFQGGETEFRWRYGGPKGWQLEISTSVGGGEVGEYTLYLGSIQAKGGYKLRLGNRWILEPYATVGGKGLLYEGPLADLEHAYDLSLKSGLDVNFVLMNSPNAQILLTAGPSANVTLNETSVGGEAGIIIQTKWGTFRITGGYYEPVGRY